MTHRIITQCQKGDLSQFEQLYLEHVKGLYQFIYFKTHRREIAEDLTSATFIKAMEKIKSYQPKKASFKTWLYQIARHNVIDYYRQVTEFKNIEDIWDLKDQTDLALDTNHQLQIEAVQKYIKTLKPNQREIILLRLWGNHSFAEISEITGKTEAACKMNFKRSVDKIKNEFSVIALLTIITSSL